jgi:hypothetical protein
MNSHSFRVESDIGGLPSLAHLAPILAVLSKANAPPAPQPIRVRRALLVRRFVNGGSFMIGLFSLRSISTTLLGAAQAHGDRK